MVQIRRYTYRAVPGFKICGTPPNDNRRVSIFARTRPVAERIREAVKRGERIELKYWDGDR